MRRHDDESGFVKVLCLALNACFFLLFFVVFLSGGTAA